MVRRVSPVVVALVLLVSSLAACTAGSGAIVSAAPDPTPTPSMAVIPTLPTGDLSPVSISNPSQGAKDAFAKCHIGDQFSTEQVAGMGQVPSIKDLFHPYRGDIPMRTGHWTDPVCIVTADSFGYYATGPSKDYGSAATMPAGFRSRSYPCVDWRHCFGVTPSRRRIVVQR